MACIWTSRIKKKTWFRSTWALCLRICHFFLNFSSQGLKPRCLHYSRTNILRVWIGPFHNIWNSWFQFTSYMIQQLFDSPQNMTPRSSISLLAQYYLLYVTMVSRSSNHRLPFTFTLSLEALSLLHHPIESSSGHILSWIKVKHFLKNIINIVHAQVMSLVFYLCC